MLLHAILSDVTQMRLFSLLCSVIMLGEHDKFYQHLCREEQDELMTSVNSFYNKGTLPKRNSD